MKLRNSRFPFVVPASAGPDNRRPIAPRRIPTERATTYKPTERGSVLIIVLWISFGLVALTLFFGQTSVFEFRSADFRVAQIEADYAIEGGARYVSYILTNIAAVGALPDPTEYEREFIPVGEARFWLIGRLANEISPIDPFFSLVDESSKLNLNTATREMLEALPRMTPELAGAIIDWRDDDDEATSDGAESDTYLRRNPPYRCKNGRFESIEELRLLAGAETDILDGEDANRNGVLDPNENDSNLSLPLDNRDGRLDPGILEFVTVYSREPNTRTNGSPRLNVTSQNRTELNQLLRDTFGEQRANQIQQQTTGAIRSVLEFFVRSRMSLEEFAQISDALTATDDEFTEGLININTAPEQVLACVPGIGPEKAAQVVAYRQTNTDSLDSIAWLAKAIDEESAVRAGPYVTSRSYQVSADIAAVGRFGRGYRRALFVFDRTGGAPKIVYRRDLSRLGWALGDLVRSDLALAKEIR